MPTRISTQLIRDLAVTTAKIAANAVTLGKLGSLSAKGSLITHNGTDHVALPVGSNDQVLVADSGAASGLAWASASGIGGSVPIGDFVFQEVPTGTINGTNAIFTLANIPHAGTERLYLDGVHMRRGSGEDYTISGGTVTFEAGQVPQSGQTLVADYIRNQA